MSNHIGDAYKMVGVASSKMEPTTTAAQGWVVANGQGDKWRMWGDSGPEWTADRDAALHFARRSDAEAFSAEDEDAWLIQPVGTPAAPGIDLRQFSVAVTYWLQGLATLPCTEATAESLREAKRLLALIDASPKGGSDAPMFYIQDTRSFVGNCPMWWAPNGAGYVTRLDEAGRFTEQEAIQQNRTRDTDLPWPCAEIDKLGRLTVDHQHMRPRRERLAELHTATAEAGS